MIDYNPENEKIMGIARSMKKPFSFSITLGEKTVDLYIYLDYFEYENESCVFIRVDIDKDTVFDSNDIEDTIRNSINAWIDDEYAGEEFQDEKISAVDEIFEVVWNYIEEKGMF